MLKGQKQIKIIQGDSYQLNVTITNNPYIIDHVVMSSKKLSIKKPLTYDSISGKYIFTLSPQETAILPAGKFDYDLTIFFVDDKVSTVIYRIEFTVLPKTNPAVIGG